MKRIIPFLMITLFLHGCMGTKFTYLDDSTIESYGTLKQFKIDDSYKLYVRQIVKTYDSATRTYKPSNAITLTKDSVIEIEYLLLSEPHNEVIILNNIPNIYQKLVDEKNKGFNLADNASSLEIDSWYFRQFRFGRMGVGGKLIFSNADNSGKDHIWNCIQNPDSINVTSISITDKYGEDTRNTKEAFALGILFRRVHSFKLIFEYKSGKKENKRSFDLKDQAFYISAAGNKYRIIFRFGQVINQGDKKNIGFTKKRMYAAPAD